MAHGTQTGPPISRSSIRAIAGEKRDNSCLLVLLLIMALIVGSFFALLFAIDIFA